MSKKTKIFRNPEKQSVQKEISFSFENQINELETDENGQVITQPDLIQIKVKGNIDGTMEVIGTMTFHMNNNDYSYTGIMNETNSKIFFNIWLHTRISNFVLKSWGRKLFYHIDVRYYLENHHIEHIDRYVELIKCHPKYDLDKFII